MKTSHRVTKRVLLALVGTVIAGTGSLTWAELIRSDPEAFEPIELSTPVFAFADASEDNRIPDEAYMTQAERYIDEHVLGQQEPEHRMVPLRHSKALTLIARYRAAVMAAEHEWSLFYRAKDPQAFSVPLAAALLRDNSVGRPTHYRDAADLMEMGYNRSPNRYNERGWYWYEDKEYWDNDITEDELDRLIPNPDNVGLNTGRMSWAYYQGAHLPAPPKVGLRSEDIGPIAVTDRGPIDAMYPVNGVGVNYMLRALGVRVWGGHIIPTRPIMHNNPHYDGQYTFSSRVPHWQPGEGLRMFPPFIWNTPHYDRRIEWVHGSPFLTPEKNDKFIVEDKDIWGAAVDQIIYPNNIPNYQTRFARSNVDLAHSMRWYGVGFHEPNRNLHRIDDLRKQDLPDVWYAMEWYDYAATTGHPEAMKGQRKKTPHVFRYRIPADAPPYEYVWVPDATIARWEAFAGKPILRFLEEDTAFVFSEGDEYGHGWYKEDLDAFSETGRQWWDSVLERGHYTSEQLLSIIINLRHGPPPLDGVGVDDYREHPGTGLFIQISEDETEELLDELGPRYWEQPEYAQRGYFRAVDRFYRERYVSASDETPRLGRFWTSVAVNAFVNPDEYLWKPTWVKMMLQAIHNITDPRKLIDRVEYHRLSPFAEAEVVEGDATEGTLYHPNLGHVSHFGLGSDLSYFHNGFGYARLRSAEHGWQAEALRKSFATIDGASASTEETMHTDPIPEGTVYHFHPEHRHRDMQSPEYVVTSRELLGGWQAYMNGVYWDAEKYWVFPGRYVENAHLDVRFQPKGSPEYQQFPSLLTTDDAKATWPELWDWKRQNPDQIHLFETVMPGKYDAPRSLDDHIHFYDYFNVWGPENEPSLFPGSSEWSHSQSRSDYELPDSLPLPSSEGSFRLLLIDFHWEEDGYLPFAYDENWFDVHTWDNGNRESNNSMWGRGGYSRYFQYIPYTDRAVVFPTAHKQSESFSGYSQLLDGWFFSSVDLFPILYSFTHEAWLTYIPETTFFYNFNDQAFVSAHQLRTGTKAP